MNVATEKLSTRFCVKVVSSEAIIMVLFSSSYFNTSPVQSFLIRDFCSRHVCAEGKKGQYAQASRSSRSKKTNVSRHLQ